MALASTSPGVTTNPSEEAGSGRMTGPMARPASIGGGGSTVRAGERRGGGPGTPSRPRRVRWRNPRRVAWRMGPDHAEPFSLEGLIFSTHASHKLVYAGHPRSNHSMPDAVPIPDVRVRGSGVRGFPDAQSPKAVLSPFTRPGGGRPRLSGGEGDGPRRPAPSRLARERRPTTSGPRPGPAPSHREPAPEGGVTPPSSSVHGPMAVSAGLSTTRIATPSPGLVLAQYVGSCTVIALIGTGLDQMKEPALNGPPWTEVGTTVVVFPTRVIRSDRILARHRIVAG